MSVARRPLVSVAIPAFNAAGTIEAAIRSVLAQSFGDLELVICDDASKDATSEIVKGFDDPRIRLVRNESNAGEGRSRDHAIRASRGAWIAVLDADDAWAPDRLEKLLRAAEGRKDRMVFDDLMICHDTPGGLVPWRALRGHRAFGTAGSHTRPVTFVEYLKSERLLIKPMFPTAFVRDHGIRHSDRKFGADSEYFIRLAHAGLGFAYLPEPLYFYRVMPGSATATAGGAHLMRECIKACAAYGWADPGVHDAFQYKIGALRDNEALYRLAASLRRFELLQCLALVAGNPRLLGLLPRRGTKHLAYQLHRMIHSGAKR